MLPVLINPLGRILGAPLVVPAPDSVTPFNRASNSDFLVGDTVESPGEDPASVPGTENPTTEDVGRVLGTRPLGAVDEESVGRRRDAHDLGSCLAGVDAGEGEAGVGAATGGSSLETEVAASSVSSFAPSGDEEAGASDTEVLDDDGDPGTTGVSGAVEQAVVVVVVVSVAADEMDSGSSAIFSSATGILGEGGGDGDGVRNWIALEMILCGGWASVEMMIPGA